MKRGDVNPFLKSKHNGRFDGRSAFAIVGMDMTGPQTMMAGAASTFLSPGWALAIGVAGILQVWWLERRSRDEA